MPRRPRTQTIGDVPRLFSRLSNRMGVPIRFEETMKAGVKGTRRGIKSFNIIFCRNFRRITNRKPPFCALLSQKMPQNPRQYWSLSASAAISNAIKIIAQTLRLTPPDHTMCVHYENVSIRGLRCTLREFSTTATVRRCVCPSNSGWTPL